MVGLRRIFLIMYRRQALLFAAPSPVWTEWALLLLHDWASKRPSSLRYFRRAQPLLRDRRASVALIAAIAMPLCVGVMALGIDVSFWEVKRIQLQRIADVAALAGSVRYSQTNNATSAVRSAASVAELNGVPAGTHTISGSTVLTDNYDDWVTSYSLNATAATLTATIQTSAPISFGRLFTAATKTTISATAVAEVTNMAGGQACVLALKGDTTGVTTYDDITFTGNTSVTSSTCGIRSDGALSVSGNATVNVLTVIASGSISKSGNSKITCTSTSSSNCQQSGAPQVADPFSSAYGNELSGSSDQLGSSSTDSNGVTTYTPGNYGSSLNFSGNGSYVLKPGVYYVNGTISVSGNATLDGSGGVTLISSAGFSFSGNGALKLTAPSTGSTAGLLLGTSTTNGVSLTGNSSSVLNGAVYAPNATVKLSGNSSTTPSSGSCQVIVGAIVTFSGNSSLSNSGCSSLGVPTTYNSPPTTLLIQ